MTEKQKRFADEYLVDCNATRAYKVAYPNVTKQRTAESAGNRLLSNVEVKSYIDEQLEKMHDEKTADAKEVVEYLTSVMRGKAASEIVVIVGTGNGESVAKRMAKLPDEKERLKAAELLGKRFGLFKENMNINTAVPVVISGGDELEN